MFGALTYGVQSLVTGNFSKSEFMNSMLDGAADMFMVSGVLLGTVGVLKHFRSSIHTSELGEVKIGETGRNSRPTWRQSEIDARSNYPDFDEQVSFKDGIEKKYGTKGSVRPDYYKVGSSVDIKNYNVETASGRSRLIKNISKQYYQRKTQLPKGTKQSVLIDIRGQKVSNKDLETLYNNIMDKTQKGITIYFKTK